jgi:aminoglycoside phosphotransferase (APT) family kinase protein
VPNQLTDLASAEFRVTVQQCGTHVKSRSGAGVHTVRTVENEPAFLKATPAGLGAQALSAARQELRFYQDLAPVSPVRTPRLLNFLDTEEGVALLLAAAGESREASSWTPDMWTDLGRDLAALHGMPLPNAEDWSRPDALQEAMAAPNLEVINDFWATTFPQLPTLISHRAELQAEINSLPPVLIHGDCHTDNIVHAAGSLIFCDWQVTGVGRPVSDLAFLSVRATPSGTVVPRVLVDAYLEIRPYDRRTLERALVAEELAIFIFLWPPFGAFNSESANDRVRRRVNELADRYFNELTHERSY